MYSGTVPVSKTWVQNLFFLNSLVWEKFALSLLTVKYILLFLLQKIQILNRPCKAPYTVLAINIKNESTGRHLINLFNFVTVFTSKLGSFSAVLIFYFVDRAT
jgi:hypothetical protein